MADKEMPKVDEVVRVVVRDEERDRWIVDARRFLFHRKGDGFFALTTGRAKWFYSIPEKLKPHFTEPDSSQELLCTFDPDELTEGPIAVVYGDCLIELKP